MFARRKQIEAHAKKIQSKNQKLNGKLKEAEHVQWADRVVGAVVGAVAISCAPFSIIFFIIIILFRKVSGCVVIKPSLRRCFYFSVFLIEWKRRAKNGFNFRNIQFFFVLFLFHGERLRSVGGVSNGELSALRRTIMKCISSARISNDDAVREINYYYKYFWKLRELNAINILLLHILSPFQLYISSTTIKYIISSR